MRGANLMVNEILIAGKRGEVNDPLCPPDYASMHTRIINKSLNVDKLQATAQSGAHIPERGESPSNSSLRYT